MVDLSSIPLFARLSPEEHGTLLGLLQVREVPAHQPIFWIGDAASECFIVRKGEVVLTYPDEGGHETILGVIHQGEFFGEISLLDGGGRTATARAQTDVELLALGRDDFHAFLRQHPAAAIHVITVIGQRQREMLGRLRGIRNVNQVIDESATLWHRVADSIAAISANQVFFAIHLVWFGFWIVLNVLRGDHGFDPFPFGLLTLVVSLEAIFLSIFVLISQNRQSEKDKIGADLDYQVNLKAHLEVMMLHRKMDRVLALLAARDPDPSGAVAAELTDGAAARGERHAGAERTGVRRIAEEERAVRVPGRPARRRRHRGADLPGADPRHRRAVRHAARPRVPRRDDVSLADHGRARVHVVPGAALARGAREEAQALQAARRSQLRLHGPRPGLHEPVRHRLAPHGRPVRARRAPASARTPPATTSTCASTTSSSRTC